MFSDLRSILHDLYNEQKTLLASPATLGAYRTIRNITHICLDSALWAAHVGGLTKMKYYFRYSEVLSTAGSHTGSRPSDVKCRESQADIPSERGSNERGRRWTMK